MSQIQTLPPTPVVQVAEHLWLKLENLQPTGSFKVRGFLNAAAKLTEDQLKHGILTVSAGNAALAAAYVARRLGIPCKVLMFETAPGAKLEGVRRLGGEVILKPRVEVLDWMATGGWKDMPEQFIHPFANADVMEGHGSLARELLDQVPDLKRVIVPVGGGGLVVGIAGGLRAAPSPVEVVGVQSAGYALWPRTFEEGEPPQITPQTIADGTTGPFSEQMHELLKTAVQRWVAVPEEDVRGAVAELAKAHKVVSEGAGALAYAAARNQPSDRNTVAVVSGGNIDPHLLATLLNEER